MKLSRQKYEIARARACMGQKDLVAAGIPKGTLCRIIGGAELRPETAGKIAKALGVDVLDIIETENEYHTVAGVDERKKGAIR